MIKMFDLKFKDNWLSELGGVVEEQKKRKSKKPVVDENQLSLFGFVA